MNNEFMQLMMVKIREKTSDILNKMPQEYKSCIGYEIGCLTELLNTLDMYIRESAI